MPMYAACSLRSHRETRTEPHSFCYTVHDSMYIRGPQTDCLCVYCLIVERLADGKIATQ